MTGPWDPGSPVPLPFGQIWPDLWFATLGRYVVCIYIFTYIYIYRYTYIHIHTYIYTYLYSSPFQPHEPQNRCFLQDTQVTVVDCHGRRPLVLSACQNHLPCVVHLLEARHLNSARYLCWLMISWWMKYYPSYIYIYMYTYIHKYYIQT